MVAAALCLAAGAQLMASAGRGPEIADTLITVGAVLVGGWLVMLASAHYSGESRTDDDQHHDQDQGDHGQHNHPEEDKDSF